MSSEGPLDIAEARSLFPSLSSQTPYIYADNAGGSQCCQAVIDRVVEYFHNSNVRLGGGDSVSKTAGDRVERGRETARILFNANSTQEVSFGSSSSLLIANLAKAIEGDFGDESEIIVTGEHEGTDLPLFFGR
jgi:selenocysteine lyase/cysteine desulfurase